jgi:hypothetical protein
VELSAPAPEKDDPEYKDKKKAKKYPYEYPTEDPDLEKGEFKFSESEIDAADDLTETGPIYGVYTVTLTLPDGWEGVTPTQLVIDIDPDNDGCAKIRFKVRRIVVVEVYKIDADHQPLGDWKIKAIPGPGNLFASPQEEETSVPSGGVDEQEVITGGMAVFTLTPGLWIFTEMPPKQEMDEAPNAYVPVVPPGGRQELLIPDDIATSEEPLRIVFKNELVTGCFYVQKLAATNDEASVLGATYNVAGWGFKLLRKDGSVARQGVTDALGELRFDNLPLGPYELVEEERPGWDVANEVGGRRFDVEVTGNACGDDDMPTVVFTNEQDDYGYCIEGRKIDANGGYGLPEWEITIKPLAKGGYDPANAITDWNGDFRFEFPRNDYRVPGAEYEICEKEVDGWLPHTETCQTVRLPEWPGACVQLKDFVNQQVGHSESQDHGKPGKGDDHGKGGPSNGGDIKCKSYHEVKAGEGLYDIGAQYKVSPQQMLDANPDVRKGNELWVYVGQRICIP